VIVPSCHKAPPLPQQLPFDELTTVFARIKGLLLTEEKVDRAVQLLVSAARDAIPGTTDAGISFLNARRIKTGGGATGRLVEQEDAAQYALGQSPCLSAIAADATVIVDDAGSDARWPLWSEAIAALPVRSLVSTPLRTDAGSIGTLKIYAALPFAFSAAAGQLLEKFAVPAATLLSNVQGTEAPKRLSEPMKDAVAHRDAINRACGMMMERQGLRAEEAMLELLRLARTRRLPLTQVCADMINGPA
jgi:GAF domain-containing protein